jgi:FkbM family methyltransferase
LAFQSLGQLAKKYSNVSIFNLALGSTAGKIDFYESNFSPTSSPLEMTEKQLSHFPESGVSKKIQVESVTLDEFSEHLELSENVLLKVDVQGYEIEVFKGAEQVLKKVKAVYVECSFVEYYKGQPVFDDVYNYLKSKGFFFVSIIGSLHGIKDAGPTQVDALFIRNL